MGNLYTSFQFSTLKEKKKPEELEQLLSLFEKTVIKFVSSLSYEYVKKHRVNTIFV